MDSKLLLELLDKKIEAKQLELNDLSTTARVLRSVLTRETDANEEQSKSGSENIGQVSEAGGVLSTRMILPRRREKLHPTFASLVLKAVDSFGDREFTSAEITDEVARQTGGENLPDEPQSKAATVLARLVDRKILERTVSGGGNVPHKYSIYRGDSANAEVYPDDGPNYAAAEDDEDDANDAK